MAPETPDLATRMPLARLLGITLVSAEPSLVVGRMPWTAELCTAGDVMHGGALMTLGDTLGAICASLNMPAGSGTATIESKTNFFRPVTNRYVEARTRPLHVGRTVIVAQTDLFDADGRHVGQVTQTQAVRSP